MLDQKAMQALMQSLQQALQILQSASAAPGGDDEMDDENDGDADNMSPDASFDDGDADNMDDDEMDDDMDGEMDDEGEEDDELDKDMGSMGSGSNLSDRIAKLESHTGLKKSATNMPLVQRVDALEDWHLGEQYEGSVAQRVEQLEGVLGLASSDEAPDVIALDDLIKSAIAEGASLAVKNAFKEMGIADGKGGKPPKGRNLPNVGEMRKAAASTQYGRRRSQAPEFTDEALAKAAKDWSMEGEDLEAPIGLADALMAQFFAGRSGGSLEEFMGED
jgi:hypothetical protein